MDCRIHESYASAKTFQRLSEPQTFPLYAVNCFGKHGLANNILSTTDPASVNIGHTIPASYEDWTDAEQALLAEGESRWPDILKMISRKRRFISPIETLLVQPGMAITLEPRLINPKDPALPMVSYHTIMLFWPDGSKELITGFEDICYLTGIEYIIQK